MVSLVILGFEKCGSKSVERGKGSEDTSSIEKNPSTEGGDVYLYSTSTQSESDVWLIDSGSFFI